MGVLNYKYTDQEQDDTGLYYYGARYYDSSFARFLAADSLLPDLIDSQQLNRFAYARSNPVRFVDPSGHFIMDIARRFLMGVAPQLVFQGGQKFVQISRNYDPNSLYGMTTGAIASLGAAAWNFYYTITGGDIVSANAKTFIGPPAPPSTTAPHEMRTGSGYPIFHSTGPSMGGFKYQMDQKERDLFKVTVNDEGKFVNSDKQTFHGRQKYFVDTQENIYIFPESYWHGSVFRDGIGMGHIYFTWDGDISTINDDSGAFDPKTLSTIGTLVDIGEKQNLNLEKANVKAERSNNGKFYSTVDDFKVDWQKEKDEAN